MIESLELTCQYCEATQDIYLAKRAEPLGDFQCFCDIDHLDSYLRSRLISKANKKIKVVGLADNPDQIETSAEQVANASEAEFVFFLYQLRALCCTDTVRQLMAKDNLGAKYEELRTSQPNSLNDLFFLTDIFKFALGKEMPAQNREFIVKRIQSIFKEAKSASMKSAEDTSMVDRAIYMMIVKNTIDTLVNLHIDNGKTLNGENGKTTQTQSAQRPPKQVNQEPPAALQFLSLDDLELKKKSLVVKEGYYAEHHVQLTSRQPDFRDITVKQLVEALRSYVYCEPDFLLAEKITKIDLIGNESSRLRILSGKETLNFLINKDVIVLRNFRKPLTATMAEMVTVDICFPGCVFGQTMHFGFNLHKPEDLELLQDVVTNELKTLYLPVESAASTPYQLRIKNLQARVKELRESFAALAKDKKAFQIEVKFDDIKFKPESEESLYSQAELDFFASNVGSIYSEKFLTEAAAFFNLTPIEIKKTLEKLEDHCSGHLKVGRFLRSVMVGDKLRDLDSLHKLSFLFPPVLESSQKDSCELVSSYALVLASVRRQAVKGQLELHTSYAGSVCVALQKLSADAPLPKILCVTANHASALTHKAYLDGLLQGALAFNSKVRYELKAVLLTEIDSRSFASGYLMKYPAEWAQWKANDLPKSNARWHKSKQVTAVFELRTNWIFL